ncbi:SpoIIE family protein phosphatase [Geodermatophilus ruber]|uniref:Serine phosphatase RsbU, regulator of sigma subunit n=1 Tax=Geodermatophilus ruber TaxID=504800 RepID=A0A1I3ZJD3_9ACTN|nr:SpoIIE family protein phosphatase [Geodermatophilus ruber]SFK43791.1 Serine phosphatase RsbU, regulator of sigma subunit [Geodermatophilus ruber]
MAEGRPGSEDRPPGSPPGAALPPVELLLADVLAGMPAALCHLDEHDRIGYANAEAERLLGRPMADLLGRPLAEVLPAEVAAPVAAACREALAAGRPVVVQLPPPGVPEGWFELHAWPVPDGTAFALIDASRRRRAQLAAERAGGRSALLAAVTAELSGALDGESALGSLARLVVPGLADACIVTVIDRAGRPRDVGSWHVDPARRGLMARYAAVRLDTLPPSSPVGRALRAGTAATESVAGVLALMAPGPAADLLRALGPETAVVVPLTAEFHTVGVLTLYQDPGRVTDDEDLAAAREVAAQAARAVDRVHRQSQQAALAEGLQRSLLTDPPAIEGARVAVRYVPAAEAARVGGDWYDAFVQRDGAPMVVIGDVVGHDTAAAAAMGQLRGLLRGIAHYSGAGPAEVLRGLDAAVAQMHTGTMATAAIIRLERGGTVLRWASAGHPPPLVADADGTVTVLSRGTGDLMLGVDPSAVRREFAVPLRPGATVLLFTDGLVERRGLAVDEGVRLLRRHLGELTGLPLERLCDALLARMLPRTPEDDVALVAISVQDGSLTMTAAPLTAGG